MLNFHISLFTQLMLSRKLASISKLIDLKLIKDTFFFFFSKYIYYTNKIHINLNKKNKKAYHS